MQISILFLTDDIGHGDSSKPSDGLHMNFPKYTYDDMVLANYKLLTEHLNVNHLRLVMGTSNECLGFGIYLS
jgi:homoserine O-acetyltransferase